MATLELDKISKRYGRRVWGARDVSLKVQDREFLVLLGPSGCGKTTTLRMVAGLEEVTSGSIFIDGKDVTDAPPRARQVSMVFQSYAVWPHMSVFDNIAFSLRLKNMPKAQIDKTVSEVAGMVKITELLERLPKQLSGGQRQRVALARALAVRPKLFLLDEPLSNLDAKLRMAMRTELKAIHQETEATSLFVTHDQSEAMSMADRIVIMRDGGIVQKGTPDDVYFRCADTFVAGFIGTPPTNFFEVDISTVGGRHVLKHPFFSYEADGIIAPVLSSYGKPRLTLGIRPEDFRITTPAEAVLSQTVLVVEPQGSHQIIAFRLDDQIVKIVAPSHPRVAPGEELHVSFQKERLHLFDSETTKRLN